MCSLHVMCVTVSMCTCVVFVHVCVYTVSVLQLICVQRPIVLCKSYTTWYFCDIPAAVLHRYVLYNDYTCMYMCKCVYTFPLDLH